MKSVIKIFNFIKNYFRLEREIVYHIGEYPNYNDGKIHLYVSRIFVSRNVSKRADGIITIQYGQRSFDVYVDEYTLIEIMSPASISICTEIKMHWWKYERLANIIDNFDYFDYTLTSNCFLEYVDDVNNPSYKKRITVPLNDLKRAGFFNLNFLDKNIRKLLRD